MEIICKSCGTVDDYRTEKKANNLVAYCKQCDRFIQNVPYTIPAIHFGKYKGTKVRDFTTPEMMNYLHWVLKNVKTSRTLRFEIYEHLGIEYDEQNN